MESITISKWNKNRLINPITGRKIKEFGPTYNKFLKIYNKNENIKKNLNKKKYSKSDLTIIKKLQKKLREKYLIKISGPGYVNPLKCINNRDIISLENIWIEKNNNKILSLEFDKILFYTYENNNKIYGYNIFSLKKLFDSKIYKDPHSNIKFDEKNISNIYKKIKFINKIKISEKKDKYNYKNYVHNKIINITKILEKNNIYIKVEWLNNLNKSSYIKIYNELLSIFNNYKMNYNDIYTKIIKKDIFNYNINYLQTLKLINLKGLIYDLINTILIKKKKQIYNK